MEPVLLGEDSKFIGKVLKNKLEIALDVKVAWYEIYQRTANSLSAQKKPYFLAALDLNVSDAQQVELVDHMLSCNMPVIVFTGEYSDNLQDEIWSKPVMDSVVKEGHYNFEYNARLMMKF